ncbi:hypothetical protein LAV73_02815 [Lysinibacillus xylanilyticus]|nr:hypothetical protein [Lysinibacillus xylanilyticus]MEB2278934.1 hypothetical protein [Lysinibacillus xylanilyticus]
MTKNIDVIVWSKQGCSYCNEVKTYFSAGIQTPAEKKIRASADVTES